MGLMIALAGWMFFYALELLTRTLVLRQWLIYLQFTFVPLTAPLWLLFLFRYLGKDSWLTKRKVTALFIIPCLTIAITWLYPKWMWSSMRDVDVNGLLFTETEHAGWFLVHTVYSYIAYGFALFLLVLIALRSPHMTFWRSVALILGALIPIFFNALYLLGFELLVGLDLTPFLLASTGLATVWSVFNVRLFDIFPLATETVMNHLTEAIIITDNYGYITAINPVAERFLGKSSAELRGADLTMLLPKNWNALFNQLNPSSSIVYPVTREIDETLNYFEMQIAPIFDRRQRLTGRIFIWRDTSHQRRSELALVAERENLAKRVEERTQELVQANTELAHANKLKDEFLAAMSHELRTPLNAIIGTTEALSDGVYGMINDKQTVSLGRIEESARHLLALINDVLDVAKTQSGEFSLHIELFSLQSVCESCLRLIRTDANKKGLTLLSALHSNREKMLGDERRVKQIIVNLLSNAVKFTPDGGRVGLGTFDDVVREQTTIVVWDTGIGISAEDQKKLFQPFVQLDSALSRQHEGTGLGLALSQRLAEMHGGRITVFSEPNKGARFMVTLPWNMQPVEVPLPKTTLPNETWVVPAPSALIARPKMVGRLDD